MYVPILILCYKSFSIFWCVQAESSISLAEIATDSTCNSKITGKSFQDCRLPSSGGYNNNI